MYISKSKGTNKKNLRQSSKTPQPTSSADTDQDPVYTIANGFSGGGWTIWGIKSHLRKMDKADDDGQTSDNDPFPDVLITDKDRGSVRRPHDDPVVIECKVINQLAGRILIDTGSS